MIYVLLMTFFLKNGLVMTSTTTLHSKPECQDFAESVVKDEVRNHPGWNIQWIDTECILVQKKSI